MVANELIETQVFNGSYGFRGERAIIMHYRHGRILISQFFGGMDTLAGGSMRWGVAVQLKPDDTFATLDADHPNVDLETNMSLALSGHDPERPMMALRPEWVAAIAGSVGL